MEHEIKTRGPLLGAGGGIREAGWARSPVLDYDRAAVRAPSWRIKEWDYYCVLGKDSGIALTIADNGYLGFLSATVFDFARRCELSDSVMTAFPLGSMKLPRGSESGLSEARAGDIVLRFEAGAGRRLLSFTWPGFGRSSAPRRPRASCCAGLPPGEDGSSAATVPALSSGTLSGEIELREIAGGDSMVIATPFPRKPKAFYFNRKTNCLAAGGGFALAGREFRFEPGAAQGVLDWGRGVWPYASTWYWGSLSGRGSVDGEAPVPVGFNIGCGFGDTSAASENLVFYGGRGSKIGPLAIEFDRRDFMKPWHAFSEDGRFDMRLEPDLDRASSVNLGLLASIQHQVFGLWSGRALLDDGRELKVEGMRGFCEKVVNRW